MYNYVNLTPSASINNLCVYVVKITEENKNIAMEHGFVGVAMMGKIWEI